LLHLVRASLKHDENDAFNSLCLFSSAFLEESLRPGTGKSASIDFLTNKHNMSLPLYENPDDCRRELTVDGSGNRSSVFSATQTHYTLGQRIEGICNTLEQIVAHQTDVSTEDGIGFRVKATLRRQLEGFDFMDVATDEDPIWPRVTSLRATGRGWVDFTRAIHAVTLFASGLGDLIRPTTQSNDGCRRCLLDSRVPKGKDFLAVCVPEIQEILQKRGSKGSVPWRLVDDIYWHVPDKTFEACSCSGTLVAKHDRVQVLLPSSFPSFWTRGLRSPARDPDLTPRGAYLFGHSQRFPLRWKDQGLPEEGDLDQELAEDVALSMQDSGLGSSLDSCSGQGTASSESPDNSTPTGQVGIKTSMGGRSRPCSPPANRRKLPAFFASSQGRSYNAGEGSSKAAAHPDDKTHNGPYDQFVDAISKLRWKGKEKAV